jgi:hypothetical protein
MNKSILDPSFKYTPSTKTDISKTFARIKRELNRPQNQDSKEPLVSPSLNPGAFVLSAEWFEME